MKDKPRKQCAKCPWKKSVDPFDIPMGYCEKKHADLKDTIATPGLLPVNGIKVMACHETDVGKELPCVGWLDNQLNEGNNIGLRMAVFDKRIDANVQTVGPQHTCLEDTLPKNKRKRRKQ